MDKLPKAVYDTIGNVDSKEEFDEVIERWHLSDSPIREEAINAMKIAHPEFDITIRTNGELMKEILEGSADISDLGSM